MARKYKYSEELKNVIQQDNVLYEYKGDKKNIIFYGIPEEYYDRHIKMFEFYPYIMGDTVHVLVLKDLFEETMKDDESFFKDVEKQIVDSLGIHRFFSIPLNLLMVLWFTWYLVLMTYPDFLYGLPYPLQVVGIVFLTTLIYGPFLVKQVVYAKRKEHINEKLLGLHKRLPNKVFRKKYKNYKRTTRTKVKDIEFTVPTPKILSYGWVKIGILYTLVMVFIATPFLILNQTLDVSIREYVVMFTDVFEFEPELPTMISTNYEFTEKITNTEERYIYQCGEFECDSPTGFLTAIYQNNEEIDVSKYCVEDVDCHTSINDGIIYIKQFKDPECEVLDRNVFVHYNDDELLFEFRATDFGYNDEATAMVYDYWYDQDNRLLYMLIDINTGVTDQSYFMVLHPDGSHQEVLLEGMYSTDLIPTENGFYFVTYLNDSNYKIQKYSKELVYEKSLAKESYNMIDLFELDDDIYYIESTTFSNIIYFLEEDFNSSEIIAHFSILHSNILVEEDFIHNDTSIRSFREFNSDFEVISKGLFCPKCEVEDYFVWRTYIKKGTTLYAYGGENTLVFEESSHTYKSISPSILIPWAGEVILSIAVVINIFIVLNIKSTNDRLKRMKEDLAHIK